MGFYYLHPGYYKDVDPNDPTAIVTTSADGNVTDKLIPAPLGELPLTMPLLQLGVPPALVTALDPFLRSVIETGYNRPDPNVAGSYPSEPVPFQLVPPPQRWLPDVLSVAAGAAAVGSAAGRCPSAEFACQQQGFDAGRRTARPAVHRQVDAGR